MKILVSFFHARLVEKNETEWLAITIYLKHERVSVAAIGRHPTYSSTRQVFYSNRIIYVARYKGACNTQYKLEKKMKTNQNKKFVVSSRVQKKRKTAFFLLVGRPRLQ